jgi:hypothetical protein
VMKYGKYLGGEGSRQLPNAFAAISDEQRIPTYHGTGSRSWPWIEMKTEKMPMMVDEATNITSSQAFSQMPGQLYLWTSIRLS